MGKVQIEMLWNEFLKTPEVGDYINSIASSAASRCGDGYGSNITLAPTRYVATVYAETPEARADNAQNNTILKNLRG